MVQINEWLANPKGTDTANEWVELYNSGDKSVSLSGWSIVNGSGKKCQIKDTVISPDGYAVIKRTECKVALRNQNETISLLDPSGRVVDKSYYSGSIGDDVSVARMGDKFVLTSSTPGIPNKVVTAEVYRDTSQLGQILRHDLSGGEIILYSIVAGILFSVASIYFIKNDHEISKLIFHGDEEGSG